MDKHEFSVDMRKWLEDEEHYSVVHYAISRGMSKEELFGMAKEDEEFARTLWYALSVQEYKVTEGILNGIIDRTVGLKMLETYNGWKGEVNVYQKVEGSLTPEMAERLASAVEKLEEFKAGEMIEGFGEVPCSVPSDFSFSESGTSS